MRMSRIQEVKHQRDLQSYALMLHISSHYSNSLINIQPLQDAVKSQKGHAVLPFHTCVLLYSSESLLEGVSSGGALGGVGWKAIGVHSLHSGVSVRLMRDASESVDNGCDDAGHARGGYIGWWRTEAC